METPVHLEEWASGVLPSSEASELLESTGCLKDLRDASDDDLEDVTKAWSKDVKIRFFAAVASLRAMSRALATDLARRDREVRCEERQDAQVTMQYLRTKLDAKRTECAKLQSEVARLTKLTAAQAKPKIIVTPSAEPTKRKAPEPLTKEPKKAHVSDSAWARHRALSKYDLPVTRPVGVQFDTFAGRFKFVNKATRKTTLYDSIDDTYAAAIGRPLTLKEDDSSDDDGIESAASMDDLEVAKKKPPQQGVSDDKWREERVKFHGLPKQRPTGIYFKRISNKWRIPNGGGTYPTAWDAYTVYKHQRDDESSASSSSSSSSEEEEDDESMEPAPTKPTMNTGISDTMYQKHYARYNLPPNRPKGIWYQKNKWQIDIHGSRTTFPNLGEAYKIFMKHRRSSS